MRSSRGAPRSPLVTSALPDGELQGRPPAPPPRRRPSRMGSSRGAPRPPPRDVGPPGWGARGEPPGSPLVTSALPDGELEGSPPAPPDLDQWASVPRARNAEPAAP